MRGVLTLRPRSFEKRRQMKRDRLIKNKASSTTGRSAYRYEWLFFVVVVYCFVFVMSFCRVGVGSARDEGTTRK